MGRIIFDPVLGWRRSVGTVEERNQTLYRNLIIGPNGYRALPNQRKTGERTVAIFGCSVTEGQWLPDEETYPYLLQEQFPDWRIEPYGIGAYSTFQNLLQLEAYLVTRKPDVVLFSFIASHLHRNVADPHLWISHQQSAGEKWIIGVGAQMNTFRPAAEFTPQGTLKYIRRYPPKTRGELDAMMQYRPDDRYQADIGVAILNRAKFLCTQAGAQFHFAVLRSEMSKSLGGAATPDHLEKDLFIQRLRSDDISVIDADPRLPFSESTFAPIDLHPNAQANVHFAREIGAGLAASMERNTA
ncbi:hypothetical protein [Pseudophaeobacter sp.]|uniref:SGNH/GDSL hydrolase family protein n=1 Tax=Pseudophaeobacter sp. TaxID=1971739 RepID=UPI003297EA5E